MSKTAGLFVTRIYRDEIANPGLLNHQIETIAIGLSRDDKTGLAWSRKHGYPGYTSYASIDDLAGLFPAFARLEKIIRRHALIYSRDLHWDLRGTRPVCDGLWVNVLGQGGSHGSHIHRNSVISGTYYVTVPEGAGAIVFEDPRLAMMMAAPPRKATAPVELRSYASETPKAGTLLLWESWLRHEVPLNQAPGQRISVSFNYVLG